MNTPVYAQYWGVDVSKRWVDIAINGQVTRVEQDARAFKRFIRQTKADPLSVLGVVESTGGYEHLISRCLSDAGVVVHIAHPNKVVAFGKAKGRTAKTDAWDARLLAAYGQFISAEELRAPPCHQQQELQALGARLEQLKAMLQQETCRQQQTSQTQVRKGLQQHVRFLKRELATVEQTLLACIEADKALRDKFHRLQTMTGVGTAVALALMIDLPELGSVDKKQIAALVGVAPRTRQSGQKTGHASTGGGRSQVRRVLYMGALVACQHNERLKTCYQRLVAAGKPKKVAVVAVMRKMLVTLNAMIKHQTDFRA